MKASNKFAGFVLNVNENIQLPALVDILNEEHRIADILSGIVSAQTEALKTEKKKGKDQLKHWEELCKLFLEQTFLFLVVDHNIDYLVPPKLNVDDDDTVYLGELSSDYLRVQTPLRKKDNENLYSRNITRLPINEQMESALKRRNEFDWELEGLPEQVRLFEKKNKKELTDNDLLNIKKQLMRRELQQNGGIYKFI